MFVFLGIFRKSCITRAERLTPETRAFVTPEFGRIIESSFSKGERSNAGTWNQAITAAIVLRWPADTVTLQKMFQTLILVTAHSCAVIKLHSGLRDDQPTCQYVETS
jgi:hypothetical protein